MRLASIDLPGFGCLSDFGCEFSPGLNVIYGDNEAGKSTLQQAVTALLYGFYDGDRANKDETLRHERFRPWQPGPYRGALAYELEDGRRFEVRRDFSTTDVVTQVVDCVLGTDVSAEFGRARHGNVPFARRHLGMSRGVFQGCAFISQGEIFDIEKSASPREIGDAIAALADSARRDVSAARAVERLEAAIGKIGSDRSRTAQLPVARERLAGAEAELSDAMEARAATAEKARRLDTLKERERHLSFECRRLERLLAVADVQRLSDQLVAYDEAEVELRSASATRSGLAQYSPLTAGIRERVTTLAARLERESILLGERRRQRSELAVTGDDLAEYAALADAVGTLTDAEILRLEEAAYEPPTAASGLLAALLALFAALLRSTASMFRRLVRRPVSAPAAAAPIPPEEARSRLEQRRRFLALKPVVESAERLDGQITECAAAAMNLERSLRNALREAGCGDEGSSWQAEVATLEESWLQHLRWREACSAESDARRRLDLISAGRDRREMARLLGEAEERLAASLGEVDPEPTDERSQGQLTAALAKARNDWNETSLAAGRLDQEIASALERFRPRAEIEEDVEHWTRETARLERARAALALARDAIGEAMTAVYRDFAPAVNAFLSDGIEFATNGRYTRAHVDPSSLQVSLLVPQTGLVVTNPPVSHGTRTLLYVLMRLGLAQHMSAIGEPAPLLLDDPFVDLDSTRLARALEFLLNLAPRAQIILFTKDQSVVEWFERSAIGDNHRLIEMSAAREPVLL